MEGGEWVDLERGYRLLQLTTGMDNKNANQHGRAVLR